MAGAPKTGSSISTGDLTRQHATGAVRNTRPVLQSETPDITRRLGVGDGREQRRFQEFAESDIGA